MKILHVIHRFVDTSQRGGELYTAALCRHLAAKHEVAVLYTSPEVAEGHLERATLGGLTTFVLGVGASWQEAKLQSGSRTAERAFATVLRKWRHDVVHFQHFLFQSLRLPKIAVQASVPSVFTLQISGSCAPRSTSSIIANRSWPINCRNCVACCEPEGGHPSAPAR